ncbi:hypothetical protein [Haloferula helveola]
MVGWIVGGGLVAAMVVSFVVETILPLHRAGRTAEMLFNLVGFPIVLLGTGVFVWGGAVFVRDTFRVWGSPEMVENLKRLKTDPGADSRRSAGGRNRAILFEAWKPGLIRMGIGAVVIAIGSIVLNWLKITGGNQMM